MSLEIEMIRICPCGTPIDSQVKDLYHTAGDLRYRMSSGLAVSDLCCLGGLNIWEVSHDVLMRLFCLLDYESSLGICGYKPTKEGKALWEAIYTNASLLNEFKARREVAFIPYMPWSR
jgi:hypothetical protein